MSFVIVFFIGGALGLIGQLLLLNRHVTMINGWLIFLAIGALLQYFSLYDMFFSWAKGALVVSLLSFFQYMDLFYLVPFLTWVISFSILAYGIEKQSKRGEWS